MQYLHEHNTFNNTIELNTAVYEHIRNNTHELNTTDRTALKMIARYAVKYAGAAHLKADTIAKLIGKSVKTARRVIDKLIRLGIVEKHATTRKVNGGKGANIIVICNTVADCVQSANESKQIVYKAPNNKNDQSTTTNRGVGETPTESKAEGEVFSEEPSDSFKRFTSTKNLETSPSPSNALRSALPHVIYDSFSPFVNAEELYEYYGLLLKAKRKIAPDTLIENDADPYIEAFNAVMFRVKRGLVKDIKNYLYVAFERAASEVDRRLKATEIDSLYAYNWLEDSA